MDQAVHIQRGRGMGVDNGWGEGRSTKAVEMSRVLMKAQMIKVETVWERVIKPGKVCTPWVEKHNFIKCEPHKPNIVCPIEG